MEISLVTDPISVASTSPFNASETSCEQKSEHINTENDSIVYRHLELCISPLYIFLQTGMSAGNEICKVSFEQVISISSWDKF